MAILQKPNIAFNWGYFGIEPNFIVDEDTIRQTQKLFGVLFPQSYLDLVTYADEASPEICSFSYGNEEACISEFFSFSSDKVPYTISWYSGPGAPPGLPKGMIPVARDAGGFLICLNFKTESTPVEIFDPNSNNIYFVANSFDEFVELWSE